MKVLFGIKTSVFGGNNWFLSSGASQIQSPFSNSKSSWVAFSQMTEGDTRVNIYLPLGDLKSAWGRYPLPPLLLSFGAPLPLRQPPETSWSTASSKVHFCF